MENRKRTIVLYLLLSVMVITITGIILAVAFTRDDSGDNPLDNNPSISQPGGDNTGDDNTPTNTTDEFGLPVAVVNVIKGYTFCENKTLGNYSFHTGIDFSGEVGTKVYCVADGVVESITTGDVLDGNVLVVAHANGVKTTYGFIDVNQTLKVGDSIQKGDEIGVIATPCGSENADGAHVHFEVIKSGKAQDPEDYITLESK